MDELIKEVKETIEVITEGVWTSDGFGTIVRKSDSKIIAQVFDADDLQFLTNAGEWINLLVERLEAAERQRDEAVKALEWYGDQKNYRKEYQPEGYLRYKANIADDAGNLARTTLKRIKGENG